MLKMKNKLKKFYFTGEIFTSYKLIKIVNEEGILELNPGVYLQTKENLIFNNEEGLKTAEDNIYNDTDNEDYIDEYNDYANKKFEKYNYYITDEDDNIKKGLMNYNELDDYIWKNKLFDKI